MRPLMNRSLLLLYCFISVAFGSINTVFVIAFFIALSISAINYYLDNQLARIISTMGYSVFACFYPALFLFMPSISYDAVFSRHILPWIPVMMSFIINGQEQPLSSILFSFMGIVVSILLYYQTMSYIKLEAVYKKNRDDSIELNQILKDKNHSILENQNNEIYTATLKERNRIARDIHDNVGHLLSRSILMTGALKAVNKNDTLEPQLNMLDETLNQAMNTIRSSVHDLHDNSVNLKEVLEGLVDTFDFCSITMNYDMHNNIPNDTKYSFISITKEALSNIMKHSNATEVHILAREHPSMYQLVIEDNGTIINQSPDSGIGLANMSDRVETLKGNILIESTSGFRIFITLPK